MNALVIHNLFTVCLFVRLSVCLSVCLLVCLIVCSFVILLGGLFAWFVCLRGCVSLLDCFVVVF